MHTCHMQSVFESTRMLQAGVDQSRDSVVIAKLALWMTRWKKTSLVLKQCASRFSISFYVFGIRTPL